MTFIRRLQILTATLLLLANLDIQANAKQPITPDSGKGDVFARIGAARIEQDWTGIADAGMRIGLPHGLELATPLAISFAPIRRRPFEIAFTMGVTDLWPAEPDTWLYTPALIVSTRSHVSHEAAVLFAVDYTHVQVNFKSSPGFLRGAGALMVNMGPYLTWCIGMSYQHVVVSGPSPPELARSGFAGRQRVSIGSVRASAFADSPLFAIHIGAHVDVTVNIRLDIDPESTSSRLEGGFLLVW
ncbi:MAG: hypothetical protein JXX14_21025 [Deltaproteobacteria bacterium]|nr:hypothetical protein [Deltaproteobacteria bacterium]